MRVNEGGGGVEDVIEGVGTTVVVDPGPNGIGIQSLKWVEGRSTSYAVPEMKPKTHCSYT